MRCQSLAVGLLVAVSIAGCSAGSDPTTQLGTGGSRVRGSGGTAGGGANNGNGGMQIISEGGTGPGGASNAGGSAGSCPDILHARIRDFHTAFPDMEVVSHDPTKAFFDDRGIVADTLDANRKPVYAGDPIAGTLSTTGKANFDKWYHDSIGDGDLDNFPIDFEFKLTERIAGVVTYDNQEFFPIDDQGYGNEGEPHNYHFTFELHTIFKYSGGETFTFVGDDDVFVFVNDKLEVDLGGVHSTEGQSIKLDSLGLTLGETYPLDLFFAERHIWGSDVRIDTTLRLCPGPILK